ncbi:MAG: hypothetical protein GC136_08655 [Alphaproteobacteria bacterium]|nr:hypothetical protein [Alphaproteobacteria bacterium]
MYHFAGIGNIAVDLIAQVDDAFLERYNFAKGQCTYISPPLMEEIKAALAGKFGSISGGAAANAACCVGLLGGRAAILGRYADDSTGSLFKETMKRYGVSLATAPRTGDGEFTAQIFCLTTPDTERTFAACYGSAALLDETDIPENTVMGSDILYLDGYSLVAPRARAAFEYALSLARKRGKFVAFNPNDRSIINAYNEDVRHFLRVSDILFLAAPDAVALYDAHDLDDAKNRLAATGKRAVVTDGSAGSWIFDGTIWHFIEIVQPDGPVVDTNGAGDNYAGGFLYGLATGMDIQIAGRLGAACASYVITRSGAVADKGLLEFIRLKTGLFADAA